jgi:hypothetical protein
VLEFIEQRSLRTPEQAAKTLEFIDHPLWRTYVFCYSGGEGLLRSWLDRASDDDARRARFWRLLTEQLTPSAIAREARESAGSRSA